MKRLYVKAAVWAIIPLVVGGVLWLVISTSRHKDGETTRSASSSGVISSQAQWALGETTNLDTISEPGTIGIDDHSVEYSRIDLSSSTITADPQTNKDEVIEDGLGTGWFREYDITHEWTGTRENPDPPDGLLQGWWKIDLGQVVDNIKRYGGVWESSVASEIPARVYYSTDDSNYIYTQGMGGVDDINYYVFPTAVSARYFKLEVRIVDDIEEWALPWSDNPFWEPYMEDVGGFLETFVLDLSQAIATHTTAATQIDGQEGSADKTLIEWETFTPTQTTPANTSIEYQFRTSADGATWTDWSSAQEYSSDPLDLTDLDPNRYLQVKATLSTTDAGSTPQIDDYTIDFHNNQKPNKPVAQTAVIGN